MNETPAMLTFMMGEYASRYPVDRLYSKNHLWGQQIGEAIRFGFTSYAVRLLQDVYFLDWIVEPVAALQRKQPLGAIESKKAESELYAPIAGDLTRLNQAVLSDPSLINADNYGEGWLYEIRGDSDRLLSPQQYVEHLSAAWEVAQRVLKRQ